MGLSAAMNRSCSLRGVGPQRRRRRVHEARTSLSAVLLALPCSPWSSSTGYGPVGRSACDEPRHDQAEILLARVTLKNRRKRPSRPSSIVTRGLAG